MNDVRNVNTHTKLAVLIKDAYIWANVCYGVNLPALPLTLSEKELGGDWAGILFTDNEPKKILANPKLMSLPFIDRDSIIKHEILHVTAWKLGHDYHDGSVWFESEAISHMLSNMLFSFSENM